MDTEKLTRIKAALQRVVELGEKATAGPWKAEGNVCTTEKLDGYYFVTCDARSTSVRQDESNAAFIAHSRNLSPWMAKALLETIEKYESLQQSNILGVVRFANEALSALTDSVPEGML